MKGRFAGRALGVVILMAMATASAQAAVLYQEDFSKESQIQGFQGKWEDGGSSGSGAGKGSFHIAGGVLDGGNGDSPTADLVRWVTGDPTWTDVKVSSHITVDGQNTGWVALLARYKDVNNWYALRYSTGQPTGQLPGDTPPSGDTELQIIKMVGGTVSILADTTDGLPAINASGADNATGADFSLSVKGDKLSAAVNGKTLLTATDASLSAGQIGVAQQEYSPVWRNITVETP
ncbi:MAG TPA: hypothetical protein VFK80_06250 [Limnochordia bacterium]|nr:hypothetical protein [Limnochordia bacterium]